MSEQKYLADSALATVISGGSSLANGNRAAGDYDNSTELDLFCDVFLTGLTFASAPAAGTSVVELYLLPGDGEASESFPEGGDGTVGDDVTPQRALLVGSFETVQPSTTEAEVLCIPNVMLHPHGNRFVIRNFSGQSINSGYAIKIKPRKFQVV